MEGTRLGKYELRARIGRGAVGTVYQAWDPVIARRVAIKVMPLDQTGLEEPEFRARFQREAQAAGRLDHPNIVRVYDYGETDRVAYIVMEYVDGIPLSARLSSGYALAWADVKPIMAQLLAGLGHSHEHGVVHRDIKPANVILTRTGQVKVSDFGVAHLEDNSMTVVGSIIGTPAYMAPEQVIGEPVDVRTDLYSVGVVLYQMVTGVRPFEGSAASIMHKLVHTPPPRPSEVSTATVPAELDAIIVKALAKRPEQRFESAADFANALGRVSGAATTPRPAPLADEVTIPSSRYSPSPSPAPAASAGAPKRFRALRWLGAGVVVLGIAGAGVAGAAIWLQPLPPWWPAALRLAPAARSVQAVQQPQAATPQGPVAIEAFDRTMRDWVTAHHVPAASLAVMQNGRLVLSRGYGTRAATDRVSVWSLSKPITAACVATLIDEGRLLFNEQIGPLLASFFRWAGPPADDRLGKVTVGQLLTHRSGLPGKGPWGGFAPGISDLLDGMRPEQLRVDMIARAVLSLPLKAAPGERYEYSSLNYLLLGEIIEARTGKPYVDACRERVLNRAGIVNAGLAPRWGGVTWSAGGWALSGPEYLAFARLLRPGQPDLLGLQGRAWIMDPADKWIDANHNLAYTLGVFLRPNPGTIWHWGAWNWHKPNAAGGAIDEKAGALFALRIDGIAWFASFDNISSDGDEPSILELDKALWNDAQALAAQAPTAGATR